MHQGRLAEQITENLPHYLSAESKEALCLELETYSQATNIYMPNCKDDETLQGDGWNGFSYYNYLSDEIEDVKGIVLSNSCDIDPNNQRDLVRLISFAPIWKLSLLEEILEDSGISKEAVDNKIRSIKSQEVTQFIYLPHQGVLEEDCVIWLCNTHSIPMSMYDKSENKSLMFRLNNVGFYMLLFKLSIHFCRFQEKIHRN